MQLLLSLNIFKELSYEPVNKYPLSFNCIILDMISLCALKLKVSFSLSLVYPFALNLIPIFIRIPAIKKRNKECMYKISKAFQMIWYNLIWNACY